MDLPNIGTETASTIQRLLGYLNFSSGLSDPQWLEGLNTLFRLFANDDEEASGNVGHSGIEAKSEPAWRSVVALLHQQLRKLDGSSMTFEDVSQADAVLTIVESHLIDAYFAFHGDLLFHQSQHRMVRAFMLGRFFEAVLSSGATPEQLRADADVWCQRIIKSLNDFLGHRPVASLESQKIEPHAHESVRPVPLFVEGAGIADGPYRELVEVAVGLLADVDEDLLEAAYFEPANMAELAYDPRAYDFDHPANKRPNYQFGEWDPHCIDNQGYYRRFVVREVTLIALLERVEQSASLRVARDELMFEAGAVLAGTILMASGVSGRGPDTHDSNTMLSNLIPRIATYRDVFYERLMDQLEAPLTDRLQNEADKLQQPFGGARQHLNVCLSRQRSLQIERAKLARVFARMGYLSAAQRQADAIQVASSRMICRIDCAMTAGRQALASRDRQNAMLQLDRIVDLIHRGIRCGAIVDPWNILGFDANFSLFRALENTVHDRRVDDLIELVGRTVDLFARLWSDAAAADDVALGDQLASKFEQFTDWWFQFAAHEVSSVDAASSRVEFEAARDVAVALREWHLQGATSGDVAFWAPHVEAFASPKAYSLVVETLLAQSDFVSSMSLLIHWLGKAPAVDLESSETSFHKLASHWVHAVIRAAQAEAHASEADATNPPEKSNDRNHWRLLRKFFDYVEANANDLWHVPSYEGKDEDLGRQADLESDGTREDGSSDSPTDDESDLDSDDLFQAAYEGVVFRDSADDGIDGAVFDSGSVTQNELEQRADELLDRLTFLSGLAQLWTISAASLGAAQAAKDTALISINDFGDTVRSWYLSAKQMRQDLLLLIRDVSNEKISQPDGDHDSMLEYDRRRLLKESMIEHGIATAVEASEAERFLLAALGLFDTSHAFLVDADTSPTGSDLERELAMASRLLSCVMRRDFDETSSLCDEFLVDLPQLQILYVPLSKSGNANQIALARMRQRIIENLLVALPRMGLLSNTLSILDAARQMERNLPVGRGAVTQFDELFKVGFREMVDALVRSTNEAEGLTEDDERDADSALVQCLERLAQLALETWLLHSRTLRLSVLESVRGAAAWNKLVEFIENYGNDLFTQRFLTLGNIRAILHCGTDRWLADIVGGGDAQFQLTAAVGDGLPIEEATAQLNLILEAIVENYEEYRDYNTTTTQSDRGELLYVLLDFIRLRTAYDRVAWNLHPVVWAHEVLVRRGRSAAAQLWRRMLAERIGEEAARYHRRLTRLQKKYAIRLASVGKRIGERFLLPMTIDRMLALVKPAVEQAGQEGATHAFEILEEESELLMREPEGAGNEGSGWLLALEREVEQINYSGDLDPWPGNELLIQPLPVHLSVIEQQLNETNPRKRH